MSDDVTIQRLRAALRGRSLDTGDFAKLLHADRSVVHAKLRGDSALLVDDLLVFRATLGVRAGFLVGEDARLTFVRAKRSLVMSRERLEVASRVRRAMLEVGVGVAGIAQVLQLSPTGVSKRLNAKASMKLQELKVIAAALNVKAAYLFGERGLVRHTSPALAREHDAGPTRD